MTAFAANSLLTRLALENEAIDAVSFATLRLASGALALAAILLWRERSRFKPTGDGRDIAALFLYTVLFSVAYQSLSVGSGALILFGMVQATMIVAGLGRGEVLRPLGWLGLFVAAGGLGYLALPGLATPSPWGAVLMASAGLAWGIYTLRGRHATDALRTTAGNFLGATPPAVLLGLWLVDDRHLSVPGVLLALVSGAGASGLGYVVWYAAVRGLTTLGASMVQLSVPVLAALGGVLLLSEVVTARLLMAAVAVLGGIALLVLHRSQATRSLRR
jgi:drug/metabolite transporter (DMT)-like permease